ncbi:MAG: type II toxin-antitoxin system VapC family toxin [Thermoanaerobaculia bacterium]
MRDQIFVDSLFVIALINRRDQYHPQASALVRSLSGRPLLTTDVVLLEIGNGLARSYRSEAAGVLERFLSSGDVKIVHMDPFLFERALDLYKKHQDKTWGLIDCVSFVVMLEEGIHEALTFDRHFAQAGFEVLMREQPM